MGKKIVERAGLIPFHKKDDKIYMMFMKPSDENFGGKEFQIAKGRVDPGEDTLTTAIREASEELGIKESNIKWVKKIGVFLTSMHVYVSEVHSMDDKDFNDYTYETGETTWLTLDEYLEIGRSLHSDIVKKCHNMAISVT